VSKGVNEADKRDAQPRGRPFGPSNPAPRKGRRKGARNVETIVREIAMEKHKVKIDGKIRRLTTAELVLLALRRKALSGDVRAAADIDRLHDRHGPAEVKGGWLVVPETMSKEEWQAMVELHNRSVVHPDER